MQNYAINNNMTLSISTQNRYSLVYLEEECDVFRALNYFGVGSMPWSPLAREVSTRPLSEQTTRSDIVHMIPTYRIRRGTDGIVNSVEQIAKNRGIRVAQVALAWILSHNGVSAPIVGTTSLKNLEELLAPIDIKKSRISPPSCFWT